jgi:RNA 3'-terminal phosphate cyclase (ATP)
MIVIDGSHGEGGGQVLRTALTLAAITGESMCIEHVRAGRKTPGLRPQHLTAVRAAAAVCGAHVEGDTLGSQTLTFAPGDQVSPGKYTFDVAQVAQRGSAGSVSLVLQTVLLPLALVNGESHLTLRGGTHVPWAPPAPYLEHVFLPLLRRMGIRARLDVVRWGFYPAGGGEIHVRINGREGPLHPITLTDRGELERVWGMAAVTNLPSHIPQRMANRARNVLMEVGLQAQIEPHRLRGAGPGAGIFLFTEYASSSNGETSVAGFTAYGRKGLPSERVAEAACEDLLTHHRSHTPVDPHLADQLVLPMVLAKGESRLVTPRVSQHLLTNVWVVRQFLARNVIIEERPDTPAALIVKE